MNRATFVFAAAMALIQNCCWAKSALPKGFVFLRDRDPSISQDIRYAGPHNFVGRPIAGYQAAECILTSAAADRLARIQSFLAARKLSLVVWDCYRPVRAVRAFVSWAKTADEKMSKEFYPRVPKSRLFALGYIAAQSAHSRGSTVDVGLAVRGTKWPPLYDPSKSQEPCFAARGVRYDEGTLDFGTQFDCFDPLAGLHGRKISATAGANRQLLKAVMEKAGFKPYDEEWWHFTLADEPFRTTSFDFPIVSRRSSSLPGANVRPHTPT
jgi:zinc D-Ala-D-Ala dipeptidase